MRKKIEPYRKPKLVDAFRRQRLVRKHWDPDWREQVVGLVDLEEAWLALIRPPDVRAHLSTVVDPIG